jgi:predicted CopG family antitoxin
MHTIDVDFEVYKQLTVRRATEQVTYNDVIRELLGIKGQAIAAAKPSNGESAEDWVAKGVRFPVGTEFRANYKGKVHTARVEGGALALNGKKYDSPSAAAMSVTDSAVNGWRFWECRIPGKSGWQLVENLRR